MEIVKAAALLAVVGADAGLSSAPGPEAGPSAVVYSLPGAGGLDETSLSGEEEGLESELSDGELAGVEEEMGMVAVAPSGELSGEEDGEETVGLEADDSGSLPEAACGAEADDDLGAEDGDDIVGVVGEDLGVGEAVGELVGAF